jgi:hypothetical protein
MKIIRFLTWIIFLVPACNGHQQENRVADISRMEAEAIPAQNVAPDNTSVIPDQPVKTVNNKKKIIRDGRMGIKTDDLGSSKSGVDSLVSCFEGYYASESYHNNDNESSYDLKVRIPSVKFDKFITALEAGNGEILYKQLDARDVTDQFIDLETRLTNKRSYLDRYRDMVKQAKNVKEILDIEEKIRVLEEEIESATGRLKYLGDLVDYSTLDLTLTKQKDYRYKPVHRDKFAERLKKSLSGGWTGLVDFSLGVVNIWPFWIIVFAVVFLWRRHDKRKKS